MKCHGHCQWLTDSSLWHNEMMLDLISNINWVWKTSKSLVLELLNKCVLLYNLALLLAFQTSLHLSRDNILLTELTADIWGHSEPKGTLSSKQTPNFLNHEHT